jgi:hypothetical protein
MGEEEGSLGNCGGSIKGLIAAFNLQLVFSVGVSAPQNIIGVSSHCNE